MVQQKLPKKLGCINGCTHVITKFLLMFVLQILLTIVSTEPSVAPTHLLVVRAGPCYDSLKTMVTVSEMSLVRDVYDSTLSGYVNISEKIDNGWSVKATMQKCHDIRNLDTCDFLKSFKIITSGCADSDDEDLYIMFFHYLEPPLDCPLQAGTYTIKEFPFFTEDSDIKAAESKISTSVFGYTYRLEGFDRNDDRILCLDAYLQLMYVREHNWEVKKELSSTSPLPAHDDTRNGDDDDDNDEMISEER